MSRDTVRPDAARRIALLIAVLASGVCGLTWEVLWQHHAGLALGVSAYGTAVTLAAMMAGMGLGGLMAARLAPGGWLRRPLRAYGLAELLIGVGGLAVPVALAGLARLDTPLYAAAPFGAELTRLLGTGLVLILPATAMGATIPILAPYAERIGTSIAVVYAVNIVGAVGGVLLATFVALPWLGVTKTGLAAAALNLAVAAWAWPQRGEAAVQSPEPPRRWPGVEPCALAFTSGFVIFVLEVSWFRSIRAAFQSTTESFAILLASFLLALALGGALARLLHRRAGRRLAYLLPLAGFAVLCATPAIDAIDRLTIPDFKASWAPTAFSLGLALRRIGWVLLLTGIPATLLGTIFPWLLARSATTADAGRLYAVNTIGAVSGSLAAGFLLLPSIGATWTSWMAGIVVCLVGALRSPARREYAAAGGLALAGLAVAVAFDGTSGRLRVQGLGAETFHEVEFVSEGPDSTVWVSKNQHDLHILVIDGFIASSESFATDYMKWMGHLPALAVPRVREALVICFGTGQTADAARQHHPARLDVVDINPAVFEAAPLFKSNHRVLEDPVVHPVVMDGRAFLRRHPEKRYDFVTLEPMPPNFAGSNNLYSREFYGLVASRLAPGGVAAQWVPFHLVSSAHMKSIIGTFLETFPITRLWINQGTGVLIGSRQPWRLHASDVDLPESLAVIGQGFVLGEDRLESLSAGAAIISDDNQLLAYGTARLGRATRPGNSWTVELLRDNLALVQAERKRR